MPRALVRRGAFLFFRCGMKIIRAKILGFCAGVRRAVLSADKALTENAGSDSHVYTLGPLIHNPVALETLAKRNLKILSESRILSKTTR